MCRMVGVVSKGPFHSEVLEDLRQVSETGKVPGWKRLGHRDGWGIATFDNGSPVYLGRSPLWVAHDDSLAGAVERASALAPPSFLVAHVRAASRGKATLPNTHPFIVDGLILAHNGTIRGFVTTASRKPMGETDSERLALVVADRYEEMHDLPSALKSVVREEVFPRKFTGAVLLATDGKVMCGYRDFSENGGYYDLRTAATPDRVVLFQETYGGIEGVVSQVKRRELVSIGPDLGMKRETIR